MKSDDSARRRNPARIAIQPGEPDFSRQFRQREHHIHMGCRDEDLRRVSAQGLPDIVSFSQPQSAPQPSERVWRQPIQPSMKRALLYTSRCRRPEIALNNLRSEFFKTRRLTAQLI